MVHHLMVHHLMARHLMVRHSMIRGPPPSRQSVILSKGILYSSIFRTLSVLFEVGGAVQTGKALGGGVFQTGEVLGTGTVARGERGKRSWLLRK